MYLIGRNTCEDYAIVNDWDPSGCSLHLLQESHQLASAVLEIAVKLALSEGYIGDLMNVKDTFINLRHCVV